MEEDNNVIRMIIIVTQLIRNYANIIRHWRTEIQFTPVNWKKCIINHKCWTHENNSFGYFVMLTRLAIKHKNLKKDQKENHNEMIAQKQLQKHRWI